MSGDIASASRTYGRVQSALLIAFALVDLFGPGPVLAAAPPARAAGLALCALGVALMGAAFWALHGVIRIEPEPRPGGRLVTQGVYRRLRHPIYTAILCIVAGIVLRRPTLALAAAAVVAFLFLKARYEEALLQRRYPQYREYRQRSWGIIPGLR